jgi:hypothetical protein
LVPYASKGLAVGRSVSQELPNVCVCEWVASYHIGYGAKKVRRKALCGLAFLFTFIANPREDDLSKMNMHLNSCFRYSFIAIPNDLEEKVVLEKKTSLVSSAVEWYWHRIHTNNVQITEQFCHFFVRM